MADSFGGSLNMVLWILIIVGGGYYSYRCLFATKGFVDQYGFGDSAVFMTRFAGTCVGASTLIALVLLFVGPQGAWAFVAFAWTDGVDLVNRPTCHICQNCKSLRTVCGVNSHISDSAVDAY